MTLEAVRAIRHGERTLFARTATMFTGAIVDRSQESVAVFMGALAESRRREAQRIIRYYVNLLGDLRA
jgi:hypothetical protein